MKKKDESGQIPDAKSMIDSSPTPGGQETEVTKEENPEKETEAGQILDAKNVIDSSPAPDGQAQKTAVKEKKPRPKPETASEKKADPYEKLAKEYAKHYPHNDTFHITSDKQVFLKGDRNLAVLHQAGLKTNEKIRTITVKTK